MEVWACGAKMSGLPREVLKWLQSLDLTWQVKTPKWDLTNGYLLAEIFSWYYPQEISMHMFNNGTSLDSKLRNWSLLQNFIKRHCLEIPEELVEGTIHCKEGAAGQLVQKVYGLLTNRGIRKPYEEKEDAFTDQAYQEKLPLHARSTASQAVKNNLRITELMADRSLILGQQKAQHIINNHIEHRAQERLRDPARFDRKPTLGELAARRPPVNSPIKQSDTDTINDQNSESSEINRLDMEEELCRGPSVQFKEIQVKQMDQPKKSLMAMAGY